MKSQFRLGWAGWLLVLAIIIGLPFVIFVRSTYVFEWVLTEFIPGMVRSSASSRLWIEGKGSIVNVDFSQNQHYLATGSVVFTFNDPNGKPGQIKADFIRRPQASGDNVPSLGETHGLRFCKMDVSIISAKGFTIDGEEQCKSL